MFCVFSCAPAVFEESQPANGAAATTMRAPIAAMDLRTELFLFTSPPSIAKHFRRIHKVGATWRKRGAPRQCVLIDAEATQRKPRWSAPLDGSPLPREPTRYRVQYWLVQRNDPPRCTRLATPGSPGSYESSGPVGLRATLIGELGVRVWSIPVRDPLPDIARDVVEPVCHWPETTRRARVPPSRRLRCRDRESAPERCWPSSGRPGGARHPTRIAFRRDLRARRTRTPPRSAGACRPTSRRPAHPRRPPGRPDSAPAAQVASRPGRMPPARALQVRPPAKLRVEQDGRRRWNEHHGSGDEILARRVRELRRHSACAPRP